MVAELVETSRLWGRDAARIDPAWVEPLAEHLVRAHATPSRAGTASRALGRRHRARDALRPADRRRAARSPTGGSTRRSSRELFIRRALVEGDWERRHAFFAANRRRLEEVEALEERARRRDLLVDDEVAVRLLRRARSRPTSSRARTSTAGGATRAARPGPAHVHRASCWSPPDAAATLDAGRPPDAWQQGDLALPLSYRFEPGAEHDGVTVHVPLKLLPQLRADGLRLARARPSARSS